MLAPIAELFSQGMARKAPKKSLRINLGIILAAYIVGKIQKWLCYTFLEPVAPVGSLLLLVDLNLGRGFLINFSGVLAFLAVFQIFLSFRDLVMEWPLIAPLCIIALFLLHSFIRCICGGLCFLFVLQLKLVWVHVIIVTVLKLSIGNFGHADNRFTKYIMLLALPKIILVLLLTVYIQDLNLVLIRIFFMVTAIFFTPRLTVVVPYLWLGKLLAYIHTISQGSLMGHRFRIMRGTQAVLNLVLVKLLIFEGLR